MEQEFFVSEFDFGVLRLRANGLMALAGNVVPQSMSIRNSRFGDLCVDKEAGEGGLLTVIAADGRFEAKYENEKWRLRTDIPAMFEAARTQAASKVENAPVPQRVPLEERVTYPASDSVQARKPLGLAGIITLVVVLAIVAVLGFYTFEEPITRIADAHAARSETRAREAEARLVEVRAAEAYRDLDKKVRATHGAALDAMQRLERNSEGLSARFREATGFSLASLSTRPEDTPQELDAVILKDGAFLRAWNQILNAYATEAELAAYRDQLDKIRQRAEAKGLNEADLPAAQGIVSDLDAKLKALAAVDTSLYHVQETLSSKRLQERISKD